MILYLYDSILYDSESIIILSKSKNKNEYKHDLDIKN